MKLIKSETITRVFAVSFLLPGFFLAALLPSGSSTVMIRSLPAASPR